MRVRIHSACTPHAHTPHAYLSARSHTRREHRRSPTIPGQSMLRSVDVRKRSFRMSKHDLEARRIYHHTRESIEAHLTIVFAALAVSNWIEHQTSWSIKKFVRTAHRHRTVTIQAGRQTLTARRIPTRRPRQNPRRWCVLV